MQQNKERFSITNIPKQFRAVTWKAMLHRLRGREVVTKYNAMHTYTVGQIARILGVSSS